MLVRLHPLGGRVGVRVELKFPELCGLGVEIGVGLRSELRDWGSQAGEC